MLTIKFVAATVGECFGSVLSPRCFLCLSLHGHNLISIRRFSSCSQTLQQTKVFWTHRSQSYVYSMEQIGRLFVRLQSSMGHTEGRFLLVRVRSVFHEVIGLDIGRCQPLICLTFVSINRST